jgi:hypothetical protein
MHACMHHQAFKMVQRARPPERILVQISLSKLQQRENISDKDDAQQQGRRGRLGAETLPERGGGDGWDRVMGGTVGWPVSRSSVMAL